MDSSRLDWLEGDFLLSAIAERNCFARMIAAPRIIQLQSTILDVNEEE